jgi:transcriptional regulator with XRE-family HTH domain
MNRTAPKKTHHEMVETWKQEPEFIAAYDELETEFTLLRELLQARQRAGLTQAEVAERMGTKPPAVTRLETALSDNRHSPSIATLKKYARAVGCKLEVHLVPAKATEIDAVELQERIA